MVAFGLAFVVFAVAAALGFALRNLRRNRRDIHAVEGSYLHDRKRAAL